MPRPSTGDSARPRGVQGRSGLITKEDLARRKATSREWRAKWAQEDENVKPISTTVAMPAASMYSGLKSATKRKRPEGTSEDSIKRVKAEDTTSGSVSSTIPDTNEDIKPRSSGWAPERKGPRKPTLPIMEKHEINTRLAGRSEWYDNINMKTNHSRSDLISLRRLNQIVKDYIEAKGANDTEKLQKIAHDLRKKIHEMEFYPFINGVLIKKSRVLEDDGLPAIFANEDSTQFPYDIRADARALYNRWMRGDIDPHLLRHIITEKTVLVSGKKRTGHKIDPSWEKESSYVIGDNGIVNGQWWPNRVCLMRDGAHGEIEAGISGQTGRGAYSIVVACGGYKDEDLSEIINYCGTESSDSAVTKNTKLMLETEKKQQVLRVFRSENKNSKYAPKKGIRYDGLYKVLSHSVVDEDKAMYLFTLKREAGQDPIRYEGPEARPTDQEVVSFTNIQQKYASMKG